MEFPNQAAIHAIKLQSGALVAPKAAAALSCCTAQSLCTSSQAMLPLCTHTHTQAPDDDLALQRLMSLTRNKSEDAFAAFTQQQVDAAAAAAGGESQSAAAVRRVGSMAAAALCWASLEGTLPGLAVSNWRANLARPSASEGRIRSCRVP